MTYIRPEEVVDYWPLVAEPIKRLENKIGGEDASFLLKKLTSGDMHLAFIGNVFFIFHPQQRDTVFITTLAAIDGVSDLELFEVLNIGLVALRKLGFKRFRMRSHRKAWARLLAAADVETDGFNFMKVDNGKRLRRNSL